MPRSVASPVQISFCSLKSSHRNLLKRNACFFPYILASPSAAAEKNKQPPGFFFAFLILSSAVRTRGIVPSTDMFTATQAAYSLLANEAMDTGCQ